MAEGSMASAVVPLVSVVIGGALTLGGQWLMQGRQAEREGKKQRADKFEALVVALYERRHWLHATRDIRVFGAEGKVTPSPFSKGQGHRYLLSSF